MILERKDLPEIALASLAAKVTIIARQLSATPFGRDATPLYALELGKG